MIKKEKIYLGFGLILSFMGMFAAFTLPSDIAHEYEAFDGFTQATETVNLLGVAINVVGVLVLLYGLSLPYFETRKENKQSKAPKSPYSSSE
jgi:hypothetical protein